jgi:hypothetical protein
MILFQRKSNYALGPFPMRLARLAMTAINSAGSTGFGK